MSNPTKRQKQAQILRIFRKVHRTMGALLFSFFFIISISGLLLGWKKNSGGYILAETQKGVSTNLADWKPLDELNREALKIYRDSISPRANVKVDRMEVRNDKGIIKFTFEDDFWGIQLDGATGKLLLIEKRRGDYIEKMHDGSLLDYYFETEHGQFKLFYTTVMGIALFIFTTTGFWLWYGPKRMRRH
ncbi:PepSY domain-containing protein [Sediminicola sp. 1XM1-17]|uniref:PepSY domain-containing protein n=1 Tax=Sediminicola sp. 1XM1-17 TaxID=3127702 RepID=UPI0030781243